MLSYQPSSSMELVNIALTLRVYIVAYPVNTGLNNKTDYTPPKDCFFHTSNNPLVPQLELVNKHEQCMIRCPRRRNVTISYNIKPRPGAGDVGYNVICKNCRPGPTGPATQIQYTKAYCLGSTFDNGIYEMEVATDQGKAYSPIYIQAEMMEAFFGRLRNPAGPGLIRFDMETNEGYSYDNNTGIFKAKRTGFYSFYITARTRTDRYITMELRRNGVRVGSITNDVLPHNDWEAEDGGNNVVLNLNYGDVVTVHANGTLQAGSMMSCFSLRTLLETPPVVLYATVTEGKVIEANAFRDIDFDDVHINTAQTFGGNTIFTVPSAGYYVVTVTNSFLNSAIHGSLISDIIKMSRYSQLPDAVRTSSSFTFIVRHNESDVILNQLFTLNEAQLSNETSIAIFKYFEIDEIDVSAVTVRQTRTHKICESEFCNPLANGIEIEDMGSDFDIETGVFTVPRGDVYVISVNFFGTQIDTTYEIVINGKVLDSVLADGPSDDYYINDSKIVVVQRLYHGDKVELRMKGRSFFYTIMSIWTLTA